MSGTKKVANLNLIKDAENKEGGEGAIIIKLKSL